RFDTRTDRELALVMGESSSALERERATWELADRNGPAALPSLLSILRRDPDPSIRWSVLWAIQKFGGRGASDALRSGLGDPDEEVRDWARLLLREISGHEQHTNENRPAHFDDTNPFDQTLPLLISGYARIQVPGVGWVQATLAPKWFESIMGRVMACTRHTTFENELVIEKRIENYHPDLSHHYEIFAFRGASQRLANSVHYHQYEAKTAHRFFLSGKVEDPSSGVISDVQASIARLAITVRTVLPERPADEFVQSVRGRYMGPAYVNLDRIAAAGMHVGPGEVQLSDYHHPVAGPLTNTILFGSFKGKLSDLNGDGMLDVNTERCHGTTTGRLDQDLDGLEDADNF
ncbi:MAG TPA: HEAT repeat domain-containing protein, partial [Nitrospiraceae bacterium]|nr:HEAT repeat domain-containing protein [Nitrospiraceae bacterium]